MWLSCHNESVAHPTHGAPLRAQELEFIIHADGRVEERVRGVKGVNCQALTEEINKALGEVYESKPTQEMFEQEIEVSVEAEATVSESWTGSSTVRKRAQARRAAQCLQAVLRPSAFVLPHRHRLAFACTVGQQWRRPGRRQQLVGGVR